MRGLILTFVMVAAAASAAEPAPGAGQRLHELFEAEWERGLRENPTWASYLGDRRFDDRWPDLSPEARARSHAVDGTHDGNFEPAQTPDQRVVIVLERFPEIGWGVARPDLAVAQVLPGAKPAAGSRQQNGARPGLPCLAQGAGKPSVHVLVQAVEAFGPIERDGSDAGIELEQDRIGHPPEPLPGTLGAPARPGARYMLISLCIVTSDNDVTQCIK